MSYVSSKTPIYLDLVVRISIGLVVLQLIVGFIITVSALEPMLTDFGLIRYFGFVLGNVIALSAGNFLFRAGTNPRFSPFLQAGLQIVGAILLLEVTLVTAKLLSMNIVC